LRQNRRRERDEGAHRGREASDPNSMASSAHSRCEWPPSHCLPRSGQGTVPAQTSTLEVGPLTLILGRLNALKSNLILSGGLT
jgi:hypothetical protein